MRLVAMLALFLNLLATIRAACRTRAELALEDLALRQQLASLRHASPRPHLRFVVLRNLATTDPSIPGQPVLSWWAAVWSAPSQAV